MKNSLRSMTMLAASFVVALVTALAVSGPHGYSSQNNAYLPTTGTYSSLQAVGFMNDAWDALLTCNKGPAAPVNAIGGSPKAGQCWLDDSNATMLVKKRYSGSGWVVEGVIDVSNGVWSPPVGGGAGTVSAAATTDLCISPAALQTVSGSGTIGSFGASCANGIKKTVVFSGVVTLTYDATSLILPGQIDYVAAAGDVIEAVALGAGNWRVTAITKINGNAVTNPAVEVGVALNYFGGAVPAKYVLGYGQALPRADYPQYVAAVTIAQTATRSSGSNTLTSVGDTSRIGAGMPIEGTGIPNGTTVASVTSSTVVMSANASSSGSSNATVFLTGYGVGGNSSTIGVPDCRGRVLAGRDDMGGTAASRLDAASGLNSSQGAKNQTLTQAQLPAVAPTFSGTAGTVTVNSSNTLFKGPDVGGTLGGNGSTNTPPVPSSVGVATSTGSFTPQGTISNLGSGESHPIVQPTLIAECMIRVLAMNVPANDDLPGYGAMPVAADRRIV